MSGRLIAIRQPGGSLHGVLTTPNGAREIVIFAGGSGEARFTRHLRQIPAAFNNAGVASLVIDLLTPEELGNPNRYSDERLSDIDLLARRLTTTVDWVTKSSLTAPFFLGIYGIGAVAAAAMVTAAERPGKVRALVLQSGRPDLAGDACGRVEAATLLIVGGLDPHRADVNRYSRRRFRCEIDLKVIPGASREFTETGKLAEVERLSTGWFDSYCAPGLMAAG